MRVRTLTCLVSVIISYSSNEKASIHAVISQALKFSEDIVVSYGSHLLDGTREDTQHIQDLAEKYPKVNFVEFQIDFSLDLSKQPGVQSRPTAYWHNLARWTGVQNLKKKQWVFILDADEVADGKLVKTWLQNTVPHLNQADCYKMANFWYFKKPIFQATTLESSVLLVHFRILTKASIFGDWERTHIIEMSKCIVHDAVKDFDGEVLWHHYSWVRSRSRMEHKLRHWAHADDTFKSVDAKQLVDTIFKDDQVNDVVHGYQYTVVNNTFDIQV